MSQADTMPDQRVRFGVFELDQHSGEVRRNGSRVKLQEQPLQVLQALLQHPGTVVSREELRQRVWPADTFVDFDRGLYSALARLRDALNDSAERPRYIETVPRRGYRFIAPIETVAPAATPAEVVAPAAIPRKAIHRYLIALGILGTGLFVALLFSGRLPWHVARNASPIRSLAVLPLENLSGNPSEEYFADGMTDELITALAQLGNVQVISRGSVMRYKGTRTTPPEIARELQVDAIVEGSFARSGQHVRITAQLIDARADRHLWARSYDRDIGDVLKLQSEVAGAIAEEVGGKLAPQQRARLASAAPGNPDAYVAFLKSRYFLYNQRSGEGGRKSVEYSLQAVQLDPQWALGYAGLADSYANASYLNALPVQDILTKAKLAAQKALQLDPDLSEAHVALGEALEDLDFDYPGAGREFRRAIELSPSNAYAHQAYADYLPALGLGRMDEAITEIKLARRLDPMSFYFARDVGRISYLARRYDEALAALGEAAQMNPNAMVVYNWMSWASERKGMIAESVEMDLKDEAANGASPEKLARLRKAFERSGIRGYLKQKLQLTVEGAYVAAKINARLGNRGEACRLLEKAYEQRSGFLLMLNVDPELDELHSDPRFQALVRRLNLTL
jgi:TolB-like protein/DNA-binding winged helix-turn-helix (wHTH) protein/Flp pilus assembly protein TadD